MSIKLVTDASCLMPYEMMKKNNIGIFESQVIINDKHYRELSEIDYEEYANNLKEYEPYPTTAQVATQDALDVFEKAHEDGYKHILYLALTPLISSHINVARMAAKKMKNKIDITLYQTDLTCGSQGAMVYTAMKRIQEGKTVEEIIKELDEIKEQIYTVGTTGEIVSLFKTGKVKRGSIKGIMVSLFNMKAIAEVNTKDGFIGIGAAFTLKSALKKMIKEILARTNAEKHYDLFMADALNRDFAERYAEEIKKVRKINRVHYWQMSPVMVTSAGKGAVTATIAPAVEE